MLTVDTIALIKMQLTEGCRTVSESNVNRFDEWKFVPLNEIVEITSLFITIGAICDN
jgi:hypothetical protein